MDDYYQLLELPRTASTRVISDRIRRELSIWQARTDDPDPAHRKDAERRVRLLGEARRALLNFDRRDRYDRALQQHEAEPQPQDPWVEAAGETPTRPAPAVSPGPAPSPPQPPPAAERTEPDHWWLRLGAEPAAPTAGCGTPGCRPARLRPTDAYCLDHERPVRAGTRTTTSRLSRLVSTGALRIALCGLLVLAAEQDSPVPLFVAGAVVGGVLLNRPLIRFPTTRHAVLGCWVLACLAVLVIRGTSPAGGGLVAVFAGLAAAVALLLHFGSVAWHGGWSGVYRPDTGVPVRRAGPVSRLLAVCAGSAVAALAVHLGLRVADRFVAVPGEAAAAALILAGVTAAVGMIVLVGASVLLGADRVDRRVGGLIRRPQSPPLYAWLPPRRRSRPPRSASPADRIAAHINGYALLLARGVSAVARSATNFVMLLSYVVGLLLTLFLNWAFRQVVLTIRLLLASLRAALVVTGVAGRIFGGTVVRTARVVLLPLLALADAAWLVLVMAEAGRSFLTGGSVLALAGMLATGVGAAVVLTIAWMAPSGQPIAQLVESMVRGAAIAVASGLVFIAVAGWAVGLPGTLGYWRIHVGWVTIAATAVAALAYLWSQLRRRGGTDDDLVVVDSPAAEPSGAALPARTPVGASNRNAWAATTVALLVALLVLAATLAPATG